MATKTTAKRRESQSQESVPARAAGVGAKTLPAVSPIQQKPIEAKVEPVQKQAEEEEPLQGKFDTVQKMDGGGHQEEEEPLQMQVAEEEPLQGKFDTIQKMDGGGGGVQEEEEPIQMQVGEEEPLQGKFDPIQKMDGGGGGAHEEEEPIQMKPGEEEPLQGKFETIQRKSIPTAQLEDGGDAPAAKAENKTGLPDNLKAGIENLSGMSVDNVRVHYNSDKPKQLKALAYAQGEDIHVAPGQEKHVPHEAWHVVQQRQGRVQPTMQMKRGVPVNDDAGLENEADVMGAQALQKGNELGSAPVQQKKNAQLKAVPGSNDITQLRTAGIFGDGYNESAEENPELAPGLNMMETGIHKSGQFAAAGAEKSWDLTKTGAEKSWDLTKTGAEKSWGLTKDGAEKSWGLTKAGAKKSWDIAAAPAKWAAAGMAGTDSKLKKAGYGIGGFFGSIGSGIVGGLGALGSGIVGGLGALGSGIVGGVGALGSGIVGGVGALGSGIVGGVGALGSGIAGGVGAIGSGVGGALTAAGGGALIGAKKGGAAAKSGIMGMFSKEKSTTEKASNGLLLGSLAATAGGSTATAANYMSGNTAPSAGNGFQGGLSGSGEAIAGLGATAGILGAVSSTAAAASFAKDASDGSLGTHKRFEAAGASVSAIAAGTKSAASAAYNIASLVNAHGAAAAGALMATAGASIAMGAIDIIRGGYGIWTATERESILAGIEAGAKESGDSEIANMAAAAKLKQDADRDSAIGNVAKGVLAVAGGAALIIAAASPVGWVLLGLAGAVGGIMLLVNAVKASNTRKEVMARQLGVKDQQDAYNAELAKIEKETWWGTDARKERMKAFKQKYPNKDPLSAAVKEKGEGKTVDQLYDKHMWDTAEMLYAQVVNPDTANPDPTNDYKKIIEGLGLKVNLKDPAKPEPSVQKIKKALSV